MDLVEENKEDQLSKTQTSDLQDKDQQNEDKEVNGPSELEAKDQQRSNKEQKEKKTATESKNFIKFLKGDYRKVSSADLQACARKMMQLVEEYKYIKKIDLKKEKEKKEKYKLKDSASNTSANTKEQKEVASLKQIIQSKSLLHYLCSSFEYLYYNKIYIKYYRNLKGLSHHKGISSARRPLKCYLYCIEYLKGLRGFMKYLDTMNYSYDIKEVLTNHTGQRNAGGYRKFSKGRMYPEDRQKHNLVFKINYGNI